MALSRGMQSFQISAAFAGAAAELVPLPFRLDDNLPVALAAFCSRAFAFAFEPFIRNLLGRAGHAVGSCDSR